MAVAEHAVPGSATVAAQRTAGRIVPLGGIPVAGAVLVGLVVSIAGNWTWALDFYHVAGGGLWTGVDLFMGFVIGPVMRTLPIPARVELTKRLMPRMLVVMPTLVTMTLASGFQLARINGMLTTSYSLHGWVVASMVVVAVMAVAALGLLQPANIAVLYELRRPDPNAAVIGALMKRFIYVAAVTGAMQVATLVIMTRLVS